VSYYPYLGALLGINVGIFSLADLTALQTVAAGQVAENLLDFDDKPAQEGPTGLAATQVLQQPAAKNNMSGTSTNPLDDLVSIFAFIIIGCADCLGGGGYACNRCALWVWWGLAGDGGALDSVESTRGSPGVVLERRTTL
jgi:hypothetical protein